MPMARQRVGLTMSLAIARPACNLQRQRKPRESPRVAVFGSAPFNNLSNMNQSDHGGEIAFATARRAARGFRNVLRTRYPLFLLGLPAARDEIPVFIFHDVEADAFARELEFLRANRYRTISLDEFVTAAGRKSGRRERRVLLTFDDARRSFYETALPVLRSFDAQATLFVPSHWMSPPEVTGSCAFMSWEQVRACVESGHVDVQSHGHRHALVPTCDQLVGFATPHLLKRYDIYDWPMRNTAAGERLGPPPLGAPIYRAVPLLSAQQRFLESPGLTTACTQLVCESGGAAFFARPDWSKRLRRLYHSRARVLRGELMSEADFSALISSEFDRAREEFRARVGYAPTCIAYPWMLGSDRSLQYASRHGFRTAFGVALDYRRARDPRLPLKVFGRLRSDWLPLLPGRGRASFLSIAARKLATFSGSQPLAH
jgi:peptidoglycan/xylan/chitin deacetylase (PgdA/CDA1 family)